MSGVFDRLQKKLDVQKHEQGISPLEIAQLPSNLRKIMRLMLREVDMKYSNICKAIQELPENNRLTTPELDDALRALTEGNWLIKSGEGEFLSYKVNLRRKAGSGLDKDIWTALNERISSGGGSPPDEVEGEPEE